MINGLEGIPGSGKSYELCAFQVLPALAAGRKVITNLPLEVEAYAAIDPGYRALIEIRYVASPIRGTWDASRVDPDTGQGQAVEYFADGHTEPAPDNVAPFGHVWDYISDWKHPKTGQGPLYVIDECHVMMPRTGTSKQVIEWYKLHRHFNADVLLATQKFRQMCADIAELMAMVIKVRKADVLGRADSYIRKVHAGYRGAVIQESVRKYEPAYFKLYRSHTQGSSVLEAGARDVAPLSTKIRRWTRAMWAVSAVACVLVYFMYFKGDGGWMHNGQLQAKAGKAVPVASAGGGAVASPKPAVAASGPVGKSDQVASSPALPVIDQDGYPEPFAGLKLHLTGCVHLGKRNMCTFAISAGGRLSAQVTSDELVAAGYKWESRGDCIGWLRWGASIKALVCDAPDAATGRDKGSPVVIERTALAGDGGLH